MNALVPSDIQHLVPAVDGAVLQPDDQGYEVANDLYNTTYRHRPAVVVAATGVADVLAAVRFAAARSLPVAVQATGHGPSVPTDDAMVVGTRLMTGVRIDPVARTARIEAGVRAGRLVREAAQFGLAPLNGASPLVGTVGYALGGGIGPLGRAYGYAADHVRELDVVTADGELRTAAPDRNTDLFWAMRGGKGNFGVVTSMEIDLFPVSRLYGGGLFFPGEAAADVLHAYRKWTTTVPENMSSSVALVRFPPVEAVPEPLRGRFVVHVRIACSGSAADGERLVRPLLGIAPVLVDTVRDMPYTDVGSIHQDPTRPGPYRERSTLLREMTEDTVEELLRLAGPGTDCPVSVVELRHLGGAMSRSPLHANAIGFREAQFSVFTVASAGPDRAAVVDGAQHSLVAALAPWRLGGPSPSFLGASEADPRHVEAAYEPATFQRLREIKAGYDPENIFRINHNIPPAVH
ncbi:FAD-binding oxidoreductase [Streptomyces griseus]|uniref:FAD-binding oxidoreductase n=1 Tax=Streptomyces griseus TaxID=1911 RepID=UPI000567E114|nr:FAD-binding oxidoreductase [Streptomyces griseus]